MGVIRNAANTLIKGRVGQVTYYISGGQQIARQSRNDSNYGETARRSESQQVRRIMWANLVNFYKASAAWMPKAFESRKRNQTDYNKFMQVNMNSSRIALTKEMAAAGACVVDNYLVTLGSLPSINVVNNTAGWSTDIRIGSLNITNATTVAEFTEAVLVNNPLIHEGVQISCVVYTQSADSYGTPRVDCRCYEVTLSSEDTSVLRSHLPALVCTSVDGSLSTNSEMPAGGFAYILSELVNGQLKVSTQQLVTNNAQMIAAYSDPRMKNLAMQSYGLDAEVILSPETTTEQPVEEVNPSISSISTSQAWYQVGTYFGTLDKLYNAPLRISYLNLDGWEIVNVFIVPANSPQIAGTNITTVSANAITAEFAVEEGSTAVLRRVISRVRNTTTGEELLITADFATSE